MPNIDDYINSIRTSVYGRDVREAIAGGIERCYSDVSTAASNVNAVSSQMVKQFDMQGESSYVIGEYVIYNGIVYKFTSAHTGPWTGTDVRPAYIADDLAYIDNELIATKNDLTDTENDLADTKNDLLYHIIPNIANYFSDTNPNPYSVGSFVIYNNSLYRFIKEHPANTSWYGTEGPNADVVPATLGTYLYRSILCTARMFNSSNSYSSGDYVIKDYRLYRFTQSHTGAWNDAHATLVYISDEVNSLKDLLNSSVENVSYNSADPFNPEHTYIQGDMVIGPNDNRLYRVKTDSYGPAPWPSSGNLNTYFEKTNDSTNVKRALQSLAATWQSGDNHPAGDFVIYKNTLQMYTSDNNAVPVHLGDVLKDVGYGLANKFDKTQSYSQGDFVVYANKLYRFTKDHSAGTNWIGTEGTNADVVGAALGTYLRRAITDVAPMFNPSNGYSSGDYVIYDYRLYQFTSSHTGDWTGNDVRQTSVIGDMPRIRTQSLGGDDYKLIIS